MAEAFHKTSFIKTDMVWSFLHRWRGEKMKCHGRKEYSIAHYDMSRALSQFYQWLQGVSVHTYVYNYAVRSIYGSSSADGLYLFFPFRVEVKEKLKLSMEFFPAICGRIRACLTSSSQTTFIHIITRNATLGLSS